jgi:hypothetical protein
MTRNVITTSNFPRSVLEEGGEGIVESGSVLGGVDDDLAEKLISNGWAKDVDRGGIRDVVASKPAPADGGSTAATADTSQPSEPST